MSEMKHDDMIDEDEFSFSFIFRYVDGFSSLLSMHFLGVLSWSDIPGRYGRVQKSF